ncbi:alkaline phosphatase family protein [Vibrio sp. B1Z05]
MKKQLIALGLGFASMGLFNAFAYAQDTQPKLVLQITVDGLRGDLLERYKHNFTDGGFRYLMDNGVYYRNAHYQHANTETIVGHASLATGAPPSVHGMVGNVWYDRAQQRLVYNVEDGDYQMLTQQAGVDQSTEIDPTQRTAKQDGRSPAPMLVSTFGDELTISNNGRSKVFAVSTKDRGAIALAGHTGKAFWFSKATAEFVTSDYYYTRYPSWVEAWNKKNVPSQYSGKRWELSLARDKYTLEEVSQQHKFDLAGFQRTFPHPYGPESFPYYSTMLTISPAGDEITADFAKTLLEEEQLGRRSVTDFLAISFSSNDYVLHLYGPSSLEAEDNLIRLDRTLQGLFAEIDKRVGLDKTVVVLSADHGAPEASPVAASLGLKQAQYFDKSNLLTDNLKQRLATEFAVNEEIIRLYTQPYVYLNHDLIKQKSINLAQLQAVIAEEAMKIKGVASAVTSEDIATGRLADSYLNTMISNNYHANRSGDVYLVFEPRTYINDMDGLTVASTHGSPWRYDTHVPVIFAGHNISAQKVTTAITPYDIAPTLSNLLGITLPSGATGNVLNEVTNTVSKK